MKTTNLGKAALVLLAVGGGLYWVIKHSKKTYQEIGRREKENREILKKSGFTEEDLDILSQKEEGEDCIDEKINLCKKLYEQIRFESTMPIDVVDLDGINHSEKVIHVCQRFDKKTKRNLLDLCFQVPVSALSGNRGSRNYANGNTCVGDFISTIRGKFNETENKLEGGWIEWMEDVVRENQNFGNGKIINKGRLVDSRLEGYYYITAEKNFGDVGEDDWQPIGMFFSIPPGIFKNNPYNSDHDKLTDYILDLISELDNNSNGEGVDLCGVNPGDDVRNVKIVDVICAVRVSFVMQDQWNLDGINATSAIKILETVYNDLEIQGAGDGIFNYEYFLIYDPDSYSDAEELRVFNTRESSDGKLMVITENYLYEE